MDSFGVQLGEVRLRPGNNDDLQNTTHRHYEDSHMSNKIHSLLPSCDDRAIRLPSHAERNWRQTPRPIATESLPGIGYTSRPLIVYARLLELTSHLAIGAEG